MSTACGDAQGEGGSVSCGSGVKTLIFLWTSCTDDSLRTGLLNKFWLGFTVSIDWCLVY